MWNKCLNFLLLIDLSWFKLMFSMDGEERFYSSLMEALGWAAMTSRSIVGGKGISWKTKLEKSLKTILQKSFFYHT